jgi:hypothetical protein
MEVEEAERDEAVPFPLPTSHHNLKKQGEPSETDWFAEALEADAVERSCYAATLASEKEPSHEKEARKGALGYLSGLTSNFKFIATRAPASEAATEPEADAASSEKPEDPPFHLDYGLYFFGPNKTARRYRKGEANPFFTGTKNIMLYVHGWSGYGITGRAARSAEETFKLDGLGCSCHPDADLTEAWARKDWEVAAFFWDNFADEALHINAERKIWTTDSAVGMRYWNGSARVTKDAPKVPAAELLREAVEELMSDCEDGVQMRLVGHSMGSQMALRSSFLLAERVEQGIIPKSYMPTRIAMLDPYWSPRAAVVNSQDWLAKNVFQPNSTSDAQEWVKDKVADDISTASLSLHYAKYITQRFGTLLEIYTSCPQLTQPPLGYQGPVDELVKQGGAALVRLRPNFCWPLDWQGRHLSALCMYLWSMTFEHLSPSSSYSIGAPSAAMSDTHLKASRGSVWEEIWQDEPGVETCSVSGSCYRKLHPLPPTPKPDAAEMPWFPPFRRGRAESAVPESVPNVVSVPAMMLSASPSSRRFADIPVAALIGFLLGMLAIAVVFFPFHRGVSTSTASWSGGPLLATHGSLVPNSCGA